MCVVNNDVKVAFLKKLIVVCIVIFLSIIMPHPLLLDYSSIT